MGPVDNSPERLLRIVVAIVGIAVLILFLGVAASAMARHPGETTELRGAKLRPDSPLSALIDFPGEGQPEARGPGRR